MQEKNTMGQQEDWELSEEYYKEENGKKELRLEDFLEAEEAPENQSGLGGANIMSYRVLRQHILRFGYVRIKQWQYPNYQPNKFSTFHFVITSLR